MHYARLFVMFFFYSMGLKSDSVLQEMTYSGQYTLIYSVECINYKMFTQFKYLTLICQFLSKSRWKLWNVVASLHILTQINGITVWYPISSLLGLTCDHGESPMLLHQWKTLNPIMDHFSGTYQCPFHNRFHVKTQIENKLCGRLGLLRTLHISGSSFSIPVWRGIEFRNVALAFANYYWSQPCDGFARCAMHPYNFLKGTIWEF